MDWMMSSIIIWNSFAMCVEEGMTIMKCLYAICAIIRCAMWDVIVVLWMGGFRMGSGIAILVEGRIICIRMMLRMMIMMMEMSFQFDFYIIIKYYIYK